MPLPPPLSPFEPVMIYCGIHLLPPYYVLQKRDDPAEACTVVILAWVGVGGEIKKVLLHTSPAKMEITIPELQHTCVCISGSDRHLWPDRNGYQSQKCMHRQFPARWVHTRVAVKAVAKPR